ncbi:MAG: DNA alkylation repair protein [Saprospiraceae bacterium]|nr:DNA alkylation repair protein [Saprospiraceae bacterium]
MTTKLIKTLKSELINAADLSRAPSMEAYMKHLFSYYGVSSPKRKKIVSSLWQSYKDEIKADLINLVRTLWKEEKRELQYVAMDLLGRCQKQIITEDLVTMEYLIISKSWWDTVDFLAANPVGHILKENPELKYQKSKEFIKSGNMWLQRTSLLFQLKYKDAVDEHLLYQNIMNLTGSKEFFINKAIGWSLRQYSKYNPKSVRRFIDENQAALANLSVREGSKYLK